VTVGKDSLQIVDQRSGQTFEVALTDGAIRATDLEQIAGVTGEGLVSYDPAFLNTASCRSAITYIDGDRGILRYRGYPIEQIVERVPFLDVAYLLINGELPTADQSGEFAAAVASGMELPPQIARLVATFPEDAHPMSVMLAAWSALGAYRPQAKRVGDATVRRQEVPRFLGSVAALAALVFRHRTGRPIDASSSEADYAARLIQLMLPEQGKPNQVLARAMDVLLILQADHEQNCSTNAVRAVGSSRVDPYSAFAAGIAALYGPLHGGANEAVLRMLQEVGDTANVSAHIEKAKRGEVRLMGFGHRVYKSYDPRASIIKRTAEEVFEVTGRNPLLDVALQIEQIALTDDYFISRKLYPNVDFYSGLIYEQMGLPTDTFTTMFVVARMAGWVAQWLELIDDPEQKIARPKQIYIGPLHRSMPQPA
jgi:citrate synthase